MQAPLHARATPPRRRALGTRRHVRWSPTVRRYSTTSAGYCGDGPDADKAGCTWRVAEVVKRVNKSCSDDAIYNEVGRACCARCSPAFRGLQLDSHVCVTPAAFEAASRSDRCAVAPQVEKVDAAKDACFATCDDSGVGPERNTSSACWIQCFYDTVLGPNAGQPGGAVEGMPLEDLIVAWDRPFLPEAKGGCPAFGGEPSRQAASLAASKWSGFPGIDLPSATKLSDA